jgi:LCP family protein required for cell wall assembly
VAATVGIGLRRSWPQRLILLAGLVVAAVSGVAAMRIWSLYGSLESIPRYVFPSGVLAEEAPEGAPVNFLLIGTDSAAGLASDDPVTIGRELDEAEALADVVMLLRLDPGTGRASVLSFPRDLWVEVPGAGEMKLSQAFQVGGPQQGVRYVAETITQTFEVAINHVVVIDFEGFREVVDAIGGVPVWFPYSAQAPSTGLIMEAGCHVLDGAQALAYVRPRKDYYEDLNGDGQFRVRDGELTQGTDFERNKRQQDFLVLALDRAVDRGARELLVQNDLIEAGSQAVTLDQDLTANTLLDLARAFADFSPESLQRYTFASPVVFDDTVRGQAVLRVRLDQAQPVLDIFRGLDGLRPAEVTVQLVDARPPADAEGGEVTLQEQLQTKAFVVGEVTEAPGAVTRTTIRFTEDQRDAALLLGRYLLEVPRFEQVAGTGALTLLAAEDVGFLFVPREADEVEDALDDVAPVEEETTTTTTATTTAPTDTTLAPGEAPPPTTSGIWGRPPEGVACG